MVAECIMAAMNNKNILNNERFSIPIVLGHDAQGKEMIVDLKRLPHLLIGGVSGSGKTIFLNSLLAKMIVSHSPNNLRVLLYNPTKVEFFFLRNVPHLIKSIDLSHADMVVLLQHLEWMAERRIKRFARAGYYNIDNFNNRFTRSDGENEVPHIVIVIDEFADLESESWDEVIRPIERIVAFGRAVGTHLVIATNRLYSKLFSLSSLFNRMVFRCATRDQSINVIGQEGAEDLQRPGDFMLGIVNSAGVRRGSVS